ncbi:MAG: DUF2207 domain-containing protein [Candidatus Heimdallarchaeota archaeon]
MKLKKNRIKFATLLFLLIVVNLGVVLYTSIDTISKMPDSVISGGGGIDSNDYYYSHWDETIWVEQDGSLLVRETMTYTLDPGSYGYAFRTLKWRSFDDVTYWNVSYVGSEIPGIRYTELTRTYNDIKFYWEWDRETWGSSVDLTFDLFYRVSSAMDLRGERDRVYWNVIGDEFEVNIYDIDTTVIFFDEFDINDVRSTTYYEGKTPGDDVGTIYNDAGKTKIDYHQSEVSAGVGYTIDADTPAAGIVMPFSIRVYLNANWIITVSMGFVPLFIFFILAFLIKGLDPKVKVIPTLNEIAIKKCKSCGYRDNRKIAFCPLCGSDITTLSEIGPPDNLSPAEVGTLLDEKFDKIDFVAEFFYLAEKGYLKIIQTDESQELYFQRTDKDAHYGELSKFDRKLIEFVERESDEVLWFNQGEKKDIPVEVASLTAIKDNVVTLWKYKDNIYQKLSGGDNKYFESNPEKIKMRYLWVAIIVGVSAGVLLYVLATFYYIFGLMISIIGVAVAGVIGLGLSQKMSKLTKEGATAKASWESYMQLIRGNMLGFPDPYDQFSFSMNHFSYLLVDPNIDLPNHLKHISERIEGRKPPKSYHYIAPYWYFYPRIWIPRRGGSNVRPISGFNSMGRGFEAVVSGISNMAESIPKAISNMAEGLTSAISNMSESFTPPSSSGGSSGFGGGFGGGGGGGGGGGIG